MNKFKCLVAGCDAESFSSSSKPLPDKFRHQAGLNFHSPKFIHCSNGHVIGIDYSDDFAEIKRLLDLLLKKPK
jgi:hypothetical protein